MFGNTTRARRRVVATIPVLALAAAGLATMGATSASAAPSHVSAPVISDDEYYMNYVAPRAEAAFGTDDELVDTAAGTRSVADAVAEAQAVDEKFSQGNPVAAKGLATLEAASVDTGKSPGQLKREWHWDTGKDKNTNKKPDYKQADETQEAKLLTILVEFNENANDDFTGAMVPTEFGSTDVRARHGAERPAAQQHPEPGRLPTLEDNNSMWVPDFSPEHYNKMLYTKTGITERVRTDLTRSRRQAAASTSPATR